MAWLILNDDIDYDAAWYPTHIIGKDNQLIPVFIGASSIINDKTIGIYVRDEDYNNIRHDKSYLFLHEPDVTEDDIEEVDWDKISNVEDRKITNREHIHIWKEIEYRGNA